MRLDRASHAQAVTGSTGGTICLEGSWWQRSVARMQQTRDGANALGRSAGRSPEAHRNPAVLDGMLRTDGRFWFAVDRIRQHPGSNGCTPDRMAAVRDTI